MSYDKKHLFHQDNKRLFETFCDKINIQGNIAKKLKNAKSKLLLNCDGF